jgi:hypothetical protein
VGFLYLCLCPKPYPIVTQLQRKRSRPGWNPRNPNQTAEASRGDGDGAFSGGLGEAYPRRDAPESPQAAYGRRQFRRRRSATEAGDLSRQGRLRQDYRGRGRCSGDTLLSPVIVFVIISMSNCSFLCEFPAASMNAKNWVANLQCCCG